MTWSFLEHRKSAVANQLEWCPLASLSPPIRQRPEVPTHENLLVSQDGIHVSNPPTFSPIFSDLNILFPLLGAFSTTHSCPLVLQGGKPCSKFIFKLRLNFPARIVTKLSCGGLYVQHQVATSGLKNYPPATESTIVSLLFWETCSLAETRKFHPPLFPTLKGHLRFRAPCRFGWGLCCENVTTSAWSCFLPFPTDVDSESTPHTFPAQ